MKCCVIMPIGPGHQELAGRAKDSVARAVANGLGAFDEVQVLEMDDTQGRLGRSHARNLAVREAGERGIEWLFFLDADDLMCPTAFVDAAPLLEDHDAIWGTIYVADLQAGQAQRREGQISPIDNLEQVLLNDPYLTLQMGHFVRQDVAAATPFDTDMDTGEDFDYYLRLWKERRCVKIDTPLFLNVRGQHSGGPRSAHGGDWRQAINRVFSAFCRDNEVVAAIPYAQTSLALRLSNTLDPLQALLASERLHDLDELEETLRHLPPEARVVEVGGHIGSYALVLTLIGGAASLDSFEAEPELAEFLDYNLRLNALDAEHFRAHGIAVGAGRNNPDESEALFGRMELKDYIQPAGAALDDLLPDAGCELLRIDRRGYELAVLRGARQLIGANRPLILVRALNDNRPALLDWAQRNAYRVVRSFEYNLSTNYLLAAEA
ncbi:FkbM family methyltransferase [Pseudomonas sp. PDNC002]|uniref:FkbM family methyltransferase n=1 Tax=Pseudomonas sp. PDNC002 TaxID=2811422 RepID=UPI0019652F9E|nr:FkbM family methyltransferase [Pseudomonas sp. PDNC002]QRY82151.1 FkbM family methyltransferase [Pseudomonas sp. PDNC002]